MTRAASGVKGRKTRLMPRLKNVWALATWRAGSAAVAATSGRERPDEREHQRGAEHLEGDVGDRHALGLGGGADGRGQRRGAGADVGAEHDGDGARAGAISPWLASARARPMVAAEEVTSALKTARRQHRDDRRVGRDLQQLERERVVA